VDKQRSDQQNDVKIERLQRWDFYNASLHRFVSWRCKNLQRQRCNYSAKNRRIGFTTLGLA
jgi:hypothetical protein